MDCDASLMSVCRKFLHFRIASSALSFSLAGGVCDGVDAGVAGPEATTTLHECMSERVRFWRWCSTYVVLMRTLATGGSVL